MSPFRDDAAPGGHQGPDVEPNTTPSTLTFAPERKALRAQMRVARHNLAVLMTTGSLADLNAPEMMRLFNALEYLTDATNFAGEGIERRDLESPMPPIGGGDRALHDAV